MIKEIIHSDHNNVEVVHVTNDKFPPGHKYEIDIDGEQYTNICFQNGPVKLHGVNGLTTEALLALSIHRTKVLDGNFPCDENKRAISYMENALALFEQRTKDRIARQVEGQNKL